MTDTRTYNYLEIIFTFREHPQYIARFGNFNINFFKSPLDFQAFIYQFLTEAHLDGVDTASFPNNLRKISCFQRTAVEGWEDVKASYVPSVLDPFGTAPWGVENVCESEMPDWYGNGKWLYNDSAKQFLDKQGVAPKFEHSTALIREMKCIPNYDGWYAYHEFDDVKEVGYALDERNLIYYGRFDECPTLDASNIALTCADCNATELGSQKGANFKQFLETTRMILGDKALECLINGGTKEQAIDFLREKEKAYRERKGEEFCEKAFDMAFRPVIDEVADEIEPEITLPECPAGQDPYKVAMLEFLSGNFRYCSAVEKAIKEHFDWEFIKTNKSRWAPLGLFDDLVLTYTLEDGEEVNFNPEECDE